MRLKQWIERSIEQSESDMTQTKKIEYSELFQVRNAYKINFITNKTSHQKLYSSWDCIETFVTVTHKTERVMPQAIEIPQLALIWLLAMNREQSSSPLSSIAIADRSNVRWSVFQKKRTERLVGLSIDTCLCHISTAQVLADIARYCCIQR